MGDLVAISTDSMATHEAVLRLYKGRCTLSARACVILALSRTYPRVLFHVSESSGRVYICHSDSRDGYIVHQRKGSRTGRINSTELADKLSRLLGGYGSYRIREEDFLHAGGKSHYPIS